MSDPKANKKMVPGIRFTGFTDDWEQRKFDSFASRNMKTRESTLNVEYEDVVSGAGKLVPDYELKRKDSKRGIAFFSGNVLFGKLRPYLKNWLLADFSGVAVGDWWVLSTKDISSSFLYSLVQSDKYQTTANQTSGTKMPRSDWKTVSQEVFSIPSYDESEVIGKMILNADQLITLHRRKLDELNDYKKLLLQKLFPKNGEQNPEWRFAGFADDWEQRKLGEILNVKKSKEYITESEISGKYKVIQQGDNPVAGYSDKEPFTDYNDVVLFGDHTVSIYQPKHPFLLATDGVKVLEALNLSGNFLYALLEKNRPEQQGYKRHFSILKGVSGIYPQKKEESVEIGNLFDMLNQTITLHQRKLEKLELLKKAMLQKMFI
ncbi:restriction endonuclease subunit S [Fructobacillus sp. M1-13]|uniref:Restriction endonuclease subunit S n=1 Tax=Fructobacillus papyriferae TaxID=2713171 RepID=A0ABS5QUG1_9LACO|nr:restriction endonuclease subunit S [Fructobacillus papyriferae]MBS9335577.1 restriction endonuclease subunit S [Fructobacillus papyriferae]MCD2159333.1 restriction endonuclease subunit S [Fructobacillus papyriferae]